MALRLRIRLKLLFGLVLIGIPMLILLGAMLHALSAHRITVKSIDSRQSEQAAATKLQDVIPNWLKELGANTVASPSQQEDLAKRLTDAADHYEQFLFQTQKACPDRRIGQEETAYLAMIRAKVKELKQSIQADDLIVGDSKINSGWQPIADQLKRRTVELSNVIDSDVRTLIVAAESSYRQTRQLVLGISIGGFVLMLIMARVMYGWIANPIRELHAKITQMAAGKFTGHVQISSNDEMQDLATAFNDMSDRLQGIYHDLEHQVQERSKQLVRSERLAGVGFLAAGVAHEINNPLASISFCGEALERRLKGILDQQTGNPDVPLINRYVMMIQQEAFRCKEITQKLLEFSRMGDRPKQMSDLAELVQGVLEMVQHLPNHQEKRIVFEVQQRPHLLLSAPEIKSVILNMIVNALESMDAGGLLTIRLNVVHDNALLSFTDTGCGMTQEVLDNLFEPFFTRSKTGKGTGLGLSISHRIINQHGGEIEATSPGPNQGSTFTLRIPLRQAETAPQEDPVATVLKKAA
ncbi:MAG: ATP-binding protein [Gemmatales bacterium]